MSTNNNLTDFLRNIANRLRVKFDIATTIKEEYSDGEDHLIDPQSFPNYILRNMDNTRLNNIFKKVFILEPDYFNEVGDNKIYLLSWISLAPETQNEWVDFFNLFQDDGIYTITAMYNYTYNGLNVGYCIVQFTILVRTQESNSMSPNFPNVEGSEFNDPIKYFRGIISGSVNIGSLNLRPNNCYAYMLDDFYITCRDGFDITAKGFGSNSNDKTLIAATPFNNYNTSISNEGFTVIDFNYMKM